MPLNNPITSALLADPEIFQQNRLPFHAHFADQTSPELPLTVSLDGEWNFRYAENLTAPFTDWDTLTVPGFIQMQSLQKPGQPYGTPHYVNTQYPWDGHEKLHPGEIPQDYNPIGEYQRSFTLPESWASCYLRLNGADSAAAVWCNGVYIGYTEDTFTPAEFDMTAAVPRRKYPDGTGVPFLLRQLAGGSGFLAHERLIPLRRTVHQAGTPSGRCLCEAEFCRGFFQCHRHL